MKNLIYTVMCTTYETMDILPPPAFHCFQYLLVY